MEADNELAISLPVYFRSVKKMKICFTRKQQKNKGPPPPLKKEKKFGESNSGSPTWKVNALFIAPQPNTRPAARCCLKPAKPYL